MRRYKATLFYSIVTGACLLLVYCILRLGKNLETERFPTDVHAPETGLLKATGDMVATNLQTPLSVLLLQVIIIVAAARTFGFLFSKIRQPAVIGEVVAGIILGPSLLGWLFPAYAAFIFPIKSLPALQLFSQLGLLLFMFVIGMELDTRMVKRKAGAAIIISHASIVIPYALGVVLAYFIYSEYAPAATGFLAFSLFIGIAMSITAFPVLARILKERGMNRSRIGALVIACAAADDITAWCLLAAVISIVKAGTAINAAATILLTIGYVAIMVKIIKPVLWRLSKIYAGPGSLSLSIVAVMLGLMLVSAYATEVIGIHALFGAFLAGVIMPPDTGFRNLLTEKVEYVSVGLLLPLFFAFSGLRTQVNLLNTPHAWLIFGAITCTAIAGKFGGSMFAAKFVGESWKNSVIIGTLINTRGLMELIVLNMGFELGVLKAELFTMMVLMALVTTFMTGPVLDLINRFSKPSFLQTGKRLYTVDKAE